MNDENLTPLPRDRRTASVGLSGLSDWTTAYPFIDVFRTARIWLGHTPEKWAAYEFADFDTDDDGWVRSLPRGAPFAEALLLVDLPAEMTFAAGTYDVTWEGEGTLMIGSAAEEVTDEGPRHTSFRFAPDGGNNVSIAVKDITPDAYIRNIRVVKREHLDAARAGAIFNPAWLDVLRGLRCVRFMDWQATNDSPLREWDQRTPQTFAVWTRGAPVEIMVDLANELEADPWFCIPHLASDDFVRQFATLVRDRLNPRLTAHFEYSNEIWNTIFGQSQWLLERARAELPGVGDGWMQLGGIRAAEVARIVASVFGERPNFRRVIGVHTAWQGLEYGLLNAPEYRKLHLDVAIPAQSFDAYAVAGYFDGELSQDAKVPEIRRWLDESTPGSFDLAIGMAVENIRTARKGYSLRRLYGDWDYHKGIADEHGLDLLMYEGGTHVVVPDDTDGDAPDGNWEELGDFYTALNYSPEMALVYRDVMDRWERTGGISFNAFVDISRPGIYGFWGGLRYLGDRTLRWDVIKGDRLVGAKG